MSAFYKPGSPIPYAAVGTSVDEAFPNMQGAIIEFKCPGFCRDCSISELNDRLNDGSIDEKQEFDKSLWHIFDSLFCGAKGFLEWGSVGVLTYEKERRNYEYSWRTVNIKLKDEQQTNLYEFFKDLSKTSEVSKYFLLGKKAERLFKERFSFSAENAAKLECLAIVPNDIEINEKWISYKTWSNAYKEPFIELDNYELEAWQLYLDTVGNKMGASNHALFFIPAVCVGLDLHRSTDEHNFSVLLAGGLVWCVHKDSVLETINEISNAQLYLRWCLGEVLKTCSNMGLPSCKWVQWKQSIETWRDSGKAFQSEQSNPPHNFPVNDNDRASVIKIITKKCGIHDTYLKNKNNGYFFHGCKGIVLNGGYNTNLGTLILILNSLMTKIRDDHNENSQLQIIEIEDDFWKTDFDLNNFMSNSDNKKIQKTDFLFFLFQFLGMLPRGKQKWVVSCNNKSNVKFTCKGSRKKSPRRLDFNKLRDSNHRRDVTILWRKFEKYANVLYEKPNHSDNKNSNVYAYDNCLEFLWKEKKSKPSRY